MTQPLLFQSAHEIAAAVNSRRASAREVTEAAIARIDAKNASLGAFTDTTFDRARKEAAAVDAGIARGLALPLAGVPFAAKNLFDVTGLVTRAGSKINRDNPPATEDAILLSRMRSAGAVLLGALNMGEYAYDFTGENAHDGPSRNPHDPTRMSGGSSGGSGTATAAGMVAIALGSDTNGSIRVPASFCGLFGLKPTFGRLSRGGTFPFVASIDHVGPLARSAVDLALAFDILQGADKRDPHQARRPHLETAPELAHGTGSLRLAIAGGYFREGAAPEANAAVDVVASALGVRREVMIPEAARARSAAYIITNAESSALHLRRLQTRAADFDPDVRDRMLAGTLIPAAWVVAAHRFRSWFRAALREVFADVDLILAPSTPFHALKSGTRTITLAGAEVPARPNIGIFTQPISFAGLPVVSVPIWLPGASLPIGVQLIAPAWREDYALRVAAALETEGIARAPVADMHRAGDR